MIGIDVEDNAIVNNVVEVLYEVVAPKMGRSSTLNGLTTPLHCIPPMSNKPTLGFKIACAFATCAIATVPRKTGRAF